jgi:hypothetical protein
MFALRADLYVVAGGERKVAEIALFLLTSGTEGSNPSRSATESLRTDAPWWHCPDFALRRDASVSFAKNQSIAC